MLPETAPPPTRERVSPPVPEYVPAALFRHPAWIEWKSTQGWSPVRASGDLVLLRRRLGTAGSMVYAPAPASLGRPEPGEDEGPDLGGALETVSLNVLPYLPDDCAFIRWDLMAPAWTDGEGRPLDPRLQELRMNASTRYRRFRKAPLEHTCPDTMVVDLRGGTQAVLSRMEYRARYSARLAERRGTVVERVGPVGLGDFHALHRSTAALRGLPLQPESRFRDLFGSARAHGLEMDLYLAKSADEPVASAIVARHGGDAWYLFAASAPERREAAGPSAILHQAILDCARSGDERMDLLGVAPAHAPRHPLAGLSLFKSGFGGIRRSRAGTWDFVLEPAIYARCSQAESLAN